MSQGSLYDREKLLQQLDEQKIWDILIIGGGATGLGIAVDAASRGLSVVLFERDDFAKGTSSRSTKLIHGGVRYMAQGDLKLVYSALHERDLVLKNAAHVAGRQSFIIPCYSYVDVLKYSVGLRLYDILAGGFGLGRSRFVSKKTVSSLLPNVKVKGLKGGVEYFDGQFDDARLAINLAQTAIELSAVTLNYCNVSALSKSSGKITGAVVVDNETGKEFNVTAKTVINATGVFVDDVLQMDNANAKKLVRPSQGVHVVIDKKFLNSASALLIPKTDDGRVLFAVPWHDRLIVGTTDTPLNEHATEPVAQQSEVNFILETVNRYLQTEVTKDDVLSVFAGLRPLAAPKETGATTKELSRDHKLMTSESGLITITGGKWTTYRKMAEETVDVAGKMIGENKSSQTKTLRIHGCRPSSGTRLSTYGNDEDMIVQLIGEDPSLDETLVNGHEYTKAEVVWAIRNEMARTIEDVLARRLRLLFLDAKAAIEAAQVVSEIFEKEMKWDSDKKADQLNSFYKIANNYILKR
jgi:glycerol-3-phosphate dehydrogenase